MKDHLVYSISHKEFNIPKSIFSQYSIDSMGMNRNFIISLRYYKYNYDSLNVLYIETEQLVKNIKTLNLLLNDNINKQLFFILIDNFQLNWGLSQPIL